MKDLKNPYKLPFISFWSSSATNIPNGKDHSWDHDQQKKIVAISQKNSCVPVKLSLVCKLVPTVVQVKVIFVKLQFFMKFNINSIFRFRWTKLWSFTQNHSRQIIAIGLRLNIWFSNIFHKIVFFLISWTIIFVLTKIIQIKFFLNINLAKISQCSPVFFPFFRT